MPGALAADIKCLQKKLVLSGIKRDEWWPPGQGEHEVTFALNLETLLLQWYQGSKTEGDTWKAAFYASPTWLTGTADWVLKAPGFVAVDDLKTGRWPVEAQDNKQLLTYALPFWIAEGCPARYTVQNSITQWPRYPLDGLPKRNWGHATGLDMALHLEDLRWALAHPGEANPERENCMFCESKSFCSDYMMSDLARR